LAFGGQIAVSYADRDGNFKFRVYLVQRGNFRLFQAAGGPVNEVKNGMQYIVGLKKVVAVENLLFRQEPV
jgi:hypothetical protein